MVLGVDDSPCCDEISAWGRWDWKQSFQGKYLFLVPPLKTPSFPIEIMISSSILLLLLFLLIPFASPIIEDDVQCLLEFKFSVSDTANDLGATWNFSEETAAAGSVCSSKGISCWNSRDNRVISISLPSLSLSGPIPSALGLCSSITALDLSHNNFCGPIPPSLCKWMPYLVRLDLSFNSLTGPIPPEISDCKYLNFLDISSNMLSGSIPHTLASLQRLHSLNLSANDLSGPVPAALSSSFNASSFIDNPSLCGYPLSDCGEPVPVPVAVYNIVIVNLVSGVAGFLLALAISHAVCRSHSSKEQPAVAPEMMTTENIERVSHAEEAAQERSPSCSGLVRVSLFREPMEEVMVADLMAASAGFLPDNVAVAGCRQIGTSYKAVLLDGTALTVKRIHECLLSEQQFRAEMCTIGGIHHPNLVPLLGYCVAGIKGRLMIYKNMPKGALSSLLECGDEHLDWPTRLRIGTGAARGLAWLHHGLPSPFLHHNFSSSAVLLDEDYEPKVTDFGLARLLGTTSSTSTEDDVYDLGVVLLELATDQLVLAVQDYLAREGSSHNLVELVLRHAVAGRLHEAIDQSLRGKGHDDQIVKFLEIACRCVAARPEERPSMYEVYRSLAEQHDEFPFLDG